MRIAIVHSFYDSRSPSGENIAVRSQAGALEADGHRVEIISQITDSMPTQLLGTQRAAFRVASGSGRNPSAQLSLFDPDIVHVHNLFPNWSTAWLHEWAPRIVLTMHNYRYVCSAATLQREGADCTLCITNSTVEAVRHACYRGSRIQTVPLALSTHPASPTRRHLAALRKIIILNRAQHDYARLLFPHADITAVPNFVPAPTTPVAVGTRARDTWVYAGRLTPEKGANWLAEHWPQGVDLHAFGSGPSTKLLQRHGSISVHAAQEHEAFLRHLSRYKGLVLPSLWTEGIPTIALEALAAGLPLLISDRISSARALTKGGAGKLFSTDNGPQTMISAMADISGDWDAMSRAARVLHANEYSPAAWLNRVGAVYRSVMDR